MTAKTSRYCSRGTNRDSAASQVLIAGLRQIPGDQAPVGAGHVGRMRRAPLFDQVLEQVLTQVVKVVDGYLPGVIVLSGLLQAQDQFPGTGGVGR
ncbi:hypothetical protein [Streptomyces sp. NPDC002088]|uniref:hypothetical protein n=1 Tax=unclassified Streptomyces TaxID=2593676 RepID=UPI00332BF330